MMRFISLFFIHFVHHVQYETNIEIDGFVCPKMDDKEKRTSLVVSGKMSLILLGFVRARHFHGQGLL